MAPKTRLQLVQRLRDRTVDERQDLLARARETVGAAHARLVDHEARASADPRQSADAAQWQLVDHAQQSALREVHRAREAVDVAREKERTALVSFAAAHRAAEVIRRVTLARAQERLQEEARKERRTLDDFASLRRR